jgi:hypothetical protein
MRLWRELRVQIDLVRLSTAADRMTPATLAMSITDAAPPAPAFSFFGQSSSEGELCPQPTTSPAFSGEDLPKGRRPTIKDALATVHGRAQPRWSHRARRQAYTLHTALSTPSTETTLPQSKMTAHQSQIELAEAWLRARNVPFARVQPFQLKIGRVNFYPTTGGVVLDGEPKRQQTGFAALEAALRETGFLPRR